LFHHILNLLVLLTNDFAYTVKVKSETQHVETDSQWTVLMSWLYVDAIDGVHYEAVTTFHFSLNSTADHIQTATNDPAYQYTWKSPQLNLK